MMGSLANIFDFGRGGNNDYQYGIESIRNNANIADPLKLELMGRVGQNGQGGGGMFDGMGDFFAGDTMKGLGQGIGALGGLWDIYNSWKQMGLAENYLDFNQDLSKANYRNSAQAYNTRLEDRTNSRRAYSGDRSGMDPGYLRRHSLSTAV